MPYPPPLDPALFNHTLYTRILRLWFPTYPIPPTTYTKEDVSRWFIPSPTIDAECAAIAAQTLTYLDPTNRPLPPFKSFDQDKLNYPLLARPFVDLLNSDHDNDDNDVPRIPVPHVALALTLLLDQFPRNIYRSPPTAEAQIYTHYDRLARAFTSEVRKDARLIDPFIDIPIWTYWFLLPLEHSEDIVGHDEEYAPALNRMLGDAERRGDESGVKFARQAMEVEERHVGPLRRFGRYPWRSEALGRESSEEEKKWLDEHGGKF